MVRSPSVDVNNLPAYFTGRQIRVQRYLVDAVTSNINHDPDGGGLTLVDDYEIGAGLTVRLTPYTLKPNAVSLVVLTPGYAEAEDLTQALSTGDGRLLEHHRRRGQPGPPQSVLRQRARRRPGQAYPTRGICQFSADGTDIGGPVDSYRSSAGFGSHHVGRIELRGPGLATITCTISGRNAASAGYDHAIDYLEFRPVL